jgi:hypothetical protein
MRQALTFVLALAILLGLFISCERFFSPSFKECIAKHQAYNASDTAKENPSGFLGSISAYVECTGDFVDKNNGSITALATIIIAAFTATLWRATTAQGKLAREAFIADKRAFVFASGTAPFYEPDATTGHFNWRIGVAWQNSGDTPTKQLRFYVDGFLTNIPITPTHDFNYIDSRAPPGPGMLGPKAPGVAGQAPHMPHQAALTPQDILDIQNGRKFFYLWGWARYFDTLPNTKEHITRFCWLIRVVGDPLLFNPAIDPHSLRFFNSYEGRGNCADEECISQGLA